MNRFKIGDRVKVYCTALANCEGKGKIIDIVNSRVTMWVLLDSGSRICVHYKQCRKLKPKVKAPKGKVNGRVYIYNSGGPDQVRFIEAEDQRV